MADTFFQELSRELAKAKEERPLLEKDKSVSDKVLDESVNTDPKPLFFHQSHNSHGNWGKHWAHGGFEDDEQEANQLIPSATQKP